MEKSGILICTRGGRASRGTTLAALARLKRAGAVSPPR